MINNLPPFELVPFSEQFDKHLNTLDTESALAWIDLHIESGIKSRDRYQAQMIQTSADHPDFKGLVHAFWIDNNNLYRFGVLRNEIRKELE